MSLISLGTDSDSTIGHNKKSKKYGKLNIKHLEPASSKACTHKKPRENKLQWVQMNGELNETLW